MTVRPRRLRRIAIFPPWRIPNALRRRAHGVTHQRFGQEQIGYASPRYLKDGWTPTGETYFKWSCFPKRKGGARLTNYLPTSKDMPWSQFLMPR